MTVEQKMAKLATNQLAGVSAAAREDDAPRRCRSSSGRAAATTSASTRRRRSRRRAAVGRLQRPRARVRRGAFRESSYTFHFPDGNASIARLLVNRLVPAAFAGQADDGDDRPGAARLRDAGRRRVSRVRIRLREHGRPRAARRCAPSDAAGVRVAYVRDGKVHGVRAANVHSRLLQRADSRARCPSCRRSRRKRSRMR